MKKFYGTFRQADHARRRHGYTANLLDAGEQSATGAEIAREGGLHERDAVAVGSPDLYLQVVG